MPEPRPAVPISEVVDQLHALGVEPGHVLLVHTSFRTVGPVEGGPAGLIQALGHAVGPQGTLVMPSWTGDNDRPFEPGATPAAPDLGVLADTFWRLPSVRRGTHPFAFAARGPAAAAIVSDPLILPPHQMASPVGRVLEHDGRILLLGVDHDANTTLHLAELLAGVPYRNPMHITVLRGGRPVRMDYLENDHCCQRFTLAGGWLKRLDQQKDGTVGHGAATLTRSRDVVDLAVGHLTRDPFTFLHPRGSECQECALAWRSVPG